MWYKKHLKQVRRARRQAKQQQHQLLKLELTGVVAISLHTLQETLVLPVHTPDVIAQIAGALREGLRMRRRQLKQEAQQLRADWQQSQQSREQDRARLRTAKSADAPASG
jgi:flagellar biosynthesis protein FlhB